ncbi:TPA: retention module-containing protein, partial [Photobacterium damselae]
MIEKLQSANKINITEGIAFALKADKGATPIKAEYNMQQDDVILLDKNTQALISDASGVYTMDASCVTCLTLSTQSEMVESLPLSQESEINFDSLVSDPFAADEIAAIQSMILGGQDPTQAQEAPAAGNEASGSAIGRFITIDYDNDSLLAEAGFDTRYQPEQQNTIEESSVIRLADAGESAAISITEGDLSPITYPVSSTTSIEVNAGSLPLDPESFTFSDSSLSSLLVELSNDITASGNAVNFYFDSSSNSIVGIQNGQLIMTIDIDSSSPNGHDVELDITTTIHQPIDHNGNDLDGFVTSSGDQILIDFEISGKDSSSNEIENNVDVEVAINDGVNPHFDVDRGVTINESTEKGQVIHSEVPLDVGSDAIDSLTFDESQPSLVGLTSNGEPTTVDISGNTITVFDNHGEPVLTVTIAADGSYEVTVTGPLDQGEGDSIDLDLSVTATDKDGDSTSGNAIISITDGQNATGGEEIAITITEGDLDTNGAATGNPTTYPVSQSGSFVIAAGEDRLVPDSVQVDPAQTQALLQELSSELTSGGQALTFTLDSNGNIVGTLPDGTVAITVSLSAVQDGQDVKVTVDIEQNVPLDHTNSGDSDGFVHSQGDNIEISVPVQAQDTDGDSLENSANVDITIVDGQNPSFGLDSGVIINETDDKAQVIHGQIPLDVGSDSIASIVFDPEQPTLVGLTSNGEPTTVDISGNTITVFD